MSFLGFVSQPKQIQCIKTTVAEKQVQWWTYEDPLTHELVYLLSGKNEGLLGFLLLVIHLLPQRVLLRSLLLQLLPQSGQLSLQPG